MGTVVGPSDVYGNIGSAVPPASPPQPLFISTPEVITGLLIGGDSFGALNWGELSILTLTQSRGLATLVATSLTAAPGMRVRVGNVTSDKRWNGFYTVKSVASSTITFDCNPTLDPAPTTTRSQMTVNLSEQRTANGEYVWAEAVNGVSYRLVDNVGIGARRLTEMVEDFDLFEGKYTNCLIDFCGGTNDPRNSISTAVSSDAIEKYILKALGRGHRVLLNTVPALAGAANTALIQQLTVALNAEIIRLGAKYGMDVYDKYNALIDPATAATAAANIDSSDNIHISPTAAKIGGIAKSAIYSRYIIPSRLNFPGTVADLVSVITTSNNILDGFFSGTGGSGGAGVVATGWTLTPTTITATGSKGTGDVGATQIITLSVASGSFVLLGPSVHASIVPGGTYEFLAKVGFANFAAGVRITLGIESTINGVVNGVAIRALTTRTPQAPIPIANATYSFRTEPIVIPADATVTNFRPSATIVTTGVPGGTETVTFQNFAIRRIA